MRKTEVINNLPSNHYAIYFNVLMVNYKKRRNKYFWEIPQFKKGNIRSLQMAFHNKSWQKVHSTEKDKKTQAFHRHFLWVLRHNLSTNNG
jgi:hypothetical protein